MFQVLPYQMNSEKACSLKTEEMFHRAINFVYFHFLWLLTFTFIKVYRKDKYLSKKLTCMN